MSSCQKNEKKIVGKWKVTKATSSDEDIDDILSEYDKGCTWSFKDNGDCTVTFCGYDCDGEYYVSKNTLSITCKIDGEKLDWDMDIDELTNKEMSLSGTFRFDYDEKYKVSYSLEKR
jgi:hypothetical protein